MRLSVVIAVLNGAETLAEQLDALLVQRAGVDWEIVVSDNGSSDGSAALVETFGRKDGRIRLVDSSQRPGLAHARNVGAEAARGRDLAFCDQDDLVGVGWAKAMVAALDRHEFIAGALEHDRLNEPWTIAVRGRPQEAGLLEYPELEYLPFAFGCTLGVRRDLHARAGGFDPAFTKGCEDADYCWRLERSGQELVFCPDAVTHYRFRSDLAGIYRQARSYGESEALLLSKHRALGAPSVRRPWALGARAWLGAVRAGMVAVNRERQAIALWRLGHRVGRLRGSLQHRVVFP